MQFQLKKTLVGEAGVEVSKISTDMAESELSTLQAMIELYYNAIQYLIFPTDDVDDLYFNQEVENYIDIEEERKNK